MAPSDPKPNPQTASRSVQLFAQCSRTCPTDKTHTQTLIRHTDRPTTLLRYRCLKMHHKFILNRVGYTQWFRLQITHYQPYYSVLHTWWSIKTRQFIFIRLKVRLQPNTGLILQRVLAVFTRSAITPPRMNRLGWNLENSWVHCRGWP